MHTVFRLAFCLAISTPTAWAGQKAVDRSGCAKRVTGAEVAPMRARLVREIKGPVGNWIKFHVTSADRVALAFADPEGRKASLYVPLEAARPVLTVAPEPGARFTGGLIHGDDALNLVTSDDQGRITTYAKGSPPHVQLGQPVLMTMDENVVLEHFAVGLGFMYRVRIVPVGGVTAREYLVDGNVIGVASHVTPAGRHLLAVATENSLKVFDVQAAGDDPVYSRQTPTPTGLFQWIVDDQNESLLAYVEGETIVVRNPLSPGQRPLTEVVGPVSALGALRLDDGANLIVANRGDADEPELLRLRKGSLARDEGLEGLTGSVALLAGPGAAPSVAFVRENTLRVARLGEFDDPAYSRPLAEGERVVGYEARRLSEARSVLAVGTNRSTYVIRLDNGRTRSRR